MTGSCLPLSPFCSASSLRKINGNIPSIKDWLSRRHMWVLAPMAASGFCQLLLTLMKFAALA